MKQNILESRRSVAFKLSALTMAAIGLPSATNVLAQASSAASNTAQSAKFILPVSAGSGLDGIVRATSAALGKALGQAVVIDNQPGAGGVVGTQTLVRAAPDGNTLSVVSNNHVIYPSVLKSIPFDPVADITPIALLGATPMVLVVHPSVPAKDLKEFAALLKANPGKYNYASSGNGTILHLAAELFKDVAGVESIHIPYKGFSPMLQDIIGNQVQWGVGALAAVAGQIKAEKLRALCVSAPQRIAAAPDIPTSGEQGFPAYLVDGWFAAIGPKGLPADQVKRIHAALVAAFATSEVKDAMAKQGNTINISSPEAALAHFKSELTRYAALVKKAGVVPQ